MRSVGWVAALALSLVLGLWSSSVSRSAPIPGPPPRPRPVAPPQPCPPPAPPRAPVAQVHEQETLLGPTPSFQGVAQSEQPDQARRTLQAVLEHVGEGTIAEVNCDEHPCIGVITFEGEEGANALVQAYLEEVALAFGSPIRLGQASWNAEGGYAVIPLAAASGDVRWLRRMHHRMSVEDEVFAYEQQEAP
jgi:hypothetical protein